MAVVASVNYTTKRIYLSASTVGVALDTLDVYREIRARRVSNEADRKFKPIIIGGGGIAKTPGVFTQQYVQLLYGCRIVPYDANHSLVVVRDTFTDDGVSGAACFDRSGITSNVDIDIQVSPVEVREITTGGGTASPDPWLQLLPGSYAPGTAGNILANIVNQVMNKADGVETNVTLQGAIRAMLAAFTGKTDIVDAGDGLKNIYFRDPADLVDRLAMTVNAEGHREAVTLNIT
jgi:hypothetical protein